MYTQAHKINNVYAYETCEKGYITTGSDYARTYNTRHENIDSTVLIEGSTKLLKTKDYIVFSDGFWGDLNIISPQLDITKISGMYNAANAIHVAENTFYCLQNEKDEKKLILFDAALKQQQTIQATIRPKFFLDSTRYITLSGTEISCYSIPQVIDWKVDIGTIKKHMAEDDAEVMIQVAGTPFMHSQHLFICVLYQDQEYTCAIDHKSGNIRWMKPGSGYIWRFHNHKYYALAGKLLHEYSPIEDSIKTISLESVFKPFEGSIPNSDFCFVDELVACNVSDKNTIVLFDPKTLEVKWQHCVVKAAVFTQILRHEHDSLFIHDTGNNLYIFKKVSV